MSVHIIELNDRNVCLRSQDGILVQSPGFANLADKQPVFGNEARTIARLHPRQTFTQYWSQLSLDPLVNSNSNFRHQADLAFAHLNDIAAQQDLKKEVFFAVPSNYNRNQLSILLGLVQSCEFDAVGLVDMPLMLAGSNAQANVFLDIQLHQSVLTSFSATGGQAVRDKVVQLPGTGLLALHDTWANMVTDEFIKQSRFDPQQMAETEQYVYNQLDEWINRALQDNEILMEINHKGSVFQARINIGHFEQRVRNIFSRIGAELDTLVGTDFSLQLTDDQARLPGLGLYLNNITAVQSALVVENCLTHLDHIKSEPGSLRFITSLPTSASSLATKKTPNNEKKNSPSHILVDHRAYSLPAALHFGRINGSAKTADGIIQIEADTGGEMKISLTQGVCQFEYDGEQKIELNGNAVSETEPLKLGDVISLPGSDTSVQLIQVE